MTTTNGGQTWNPVDLPQYNGVAVTSVTSLSCPDSATCFALASDPTGKAVPGQRQQLVLVGGVLPS